MTTSSDLDPAMLMGNGVQVDICPSESGFVLSIGHVSVWLDAAAVKDVIRTLTWALSLHVPGAALTQLSVRAAPDSSQERTRPAANKARSSSRRSSSRAKG
jgi:hypothetical protein